jgi:lipooligosaccharide transport system permease protein
MNGAIFDSTFNIFFKLKIAKTYDAMLSTPLAPGDIALGELTWAILRGSIYSAAFLLAMTGFGYVLTPWAALCYPAAVLTTFAFAGLGMAATSYMRSWQDFDKVSLAIIPLFLFSATFYPSWGSSVWPSPAGASPPCCCPERSFFSGPFYEPRLFYRKRPRPLPRERPTPTV